ncbi:hypothetical protein [uncultured Psychrobacillus sp.]|uniref:hypothetical protein n=1 Tax=uncultured Psychrobacillus sp. TaxID=1551585 RepID=UPI00261CA093|nr:hypothetical protein [uncultured Psychrobacillus sp.]
MDKIFKNIKNNMNQTVLKDIDFNEKNKKKVRQIIENRKKKRFPLKPTFHFLLPLGATCLLFLGVGYFTLSEFGILSKDNKTSYLNNTSDNVLRTSENEASLIKPPLLEESYEDMTKEEVFVKLLNTVDYFHTAAGKFETYDLYSDDSDSTTITEYKISIKNKIGGYEKITDLFDEKLMGSKEGVQEISYMNGDIWIKSHDTKTYFVSDYQQAPTQEALTLEEALSISIKDIYKSDNGFREGSPIGRSGISLFPYELASIYLRNMSLWDIEKQNEELLGHNTIVLNGKIDDQVKSRFNMKGTTETFRFWVDKDTGILIKYETYDADGELTSYLHPELLEVNSEINPQEFVPNLDGFKPHIKKDFLQVDPREEEIELVDQADGVKEDRDAVLQLLRKDLPFLYEFTHPDLKLFSASYEKYKNFNHGYLTYNYKDEKGVVYVRAYHKDSIIRTSSDFNKEKEEPKESFTLNNIQWASYELNNPIGAHFIGYKGDYKYEVVSQTISLEETKDLLKSFIPTKQ